LCDASLQLPGRGERRGVWPQRVGLRAPYAAAAVRDWRRMLS